MIKTIYDRETDDRSRTVTFSVTAQYEDIENKTSFMFTYDKEGNIIDEQSYNPMTGWTSWNNFTQGWSEQDATDNEVWAAIHEFVNEDIYMDFVDFSAESLDDIGNKDYYDFIHQNYIMEYMELVIIVEIEDIEFKGR